ncbi:MAG TPA: hypothetical protein VE201_10410 [Nitrospirales bacterium]|nr:hypothetical protein [Nitrospirales bacterium]
MAQLPEIFPYLLAVFGLTLLWKLHDMLVKAGRIQSRDFWERSGVRLFLRVTPNDAQACTACRETTSMVFSPAVVTSKKFSPQEIPCINPSRCRCLMVGLYGGWPAAAAVLSRLKKEGGTLRLSDEELKELIDGSAEARAGASADQVSLRLVHAMRAEGKDPATALEHYRYIVDCAKADRDLQFVFPSVLRLSELLERTGQPDEAIDWIEHYLLEYGGKKKGPAAPTEAQRAALKTRQSLLAAKVRK